VLLLKLIVKQAIIWMKFASLKSTVANPHTAAFNDLGINTSGSTKHGNHICESRERMYRHFKGIVVLGHQSYWHPQRIPMSVIFLLALKQLELPLRGRDRFGL
jgi:hypothetical protein